MKHEIHRFSFPTTIHFGFGARHLVGDALKKQGIKRPLLVTDRGIAALPFFKDFLKDVQKSGLDVGVFSEVWGNPVKSQVNAGAESYKKHKADGLIGLGGGAALDVAKAIAVVVSHPGDLFDYEDEKPGARMLDGVVPPWVALPTTAGTGSEVGRSTVISDDTTHVKKIIFSPKLLASAVFADPELTLGLPPAVTAATGMDALTHCVEAFLAKAYHPICDGIALEGLRLASLHLTAAVKDPKNESARAGMLLSSMMGAIAFQKGLGVTHSCAHALSTVANLHHGLANGVMVDFAMEFNIPAATPKFSRLAQTVGLARTDGLSFVQWLSALKKEIGIPATLTAAGVSKDKLNALVEIAVSDGCHANNPRLCSREEFETLFTEAF